MAFRMRPSVSIIVPSWNGSELLARNLPSVLEAVKRVDAVTDLCVVDDGSLDDTCEFLKHTFPTVRVIRRSRNGGFVAAVNDGVRQAGGDYVLLLNNDISVESDFMAPLLAPFENNPDLFAATSQQCDPAGTSDSLSAGSTSVEIRKGHFIFHNRPGDIAPPISCQHPVAYGGCSMMDRRKLFALGGFCPLFTPFYYEDVELSFQALCRGWQILYVPQSRVWHAAGSSTRKRKILMQLIPMRNYFYLHWLTLDTPDLWRDFRAQCLLKLLTWPRAGNRKYALGFIMALWRWPQAAAWRRRRHSGMKKTIREALAPFSPA